MVWHDASRSADLVTGNADSRACVLGGSVFLWKAAFLDPASMISISVSLLVTAFSGVSLDALFTAKDSAFLTAP